MIYKEAGSPLKSEPVDVGIFCLPPCLELRLAFSHFVAAGETGNHAFPPAGPGYVSAAMEPANLQYAPLRIDFVLFFKSPATGFRNTLLLKGIIKSRESIARSIDMVLHFFQ